MHKGLLTCVACILATSLNVFAQTAATPLEVRLICYDLLFYPATIEFFGGIEDENRVSSQGRFATPNDEMAFAPPDVPTTHWGTFHYTDGQTFETFAMNFEVNIPGVDANNNGINDLLEFSQAVTSTSTVGTYSDDEGEGQFLATWSKPANSQSGTCRIRFDFLNEAFVHGFEILNYSGTWTSAVKENSTVRGPITVTRAGTPTSKLSGELALSLAQPGAVKLLTTSLKDENNLTFEWAPPTTMERDGTEYYEFLEVRDGWLYEPTEDFRDWLLIVDDKNDGDADGIPDLTDPPSNVPATPPTMQIIKTENGVRLMITGDVGRTYTLESTTALPAASWSNATPVTLTTNPHTLDLTAPPSSMFWRMRFP